MSFVIYDLIFLVVFCFFLAWFFYTRRKKVDRELGIMFLYKTQWGVKMIERFSKRYQRILRGLQYIIVSTGYLLMTLIVYMMGRSILMYIFDSKEIVKTIDAPPIAPVIPYFPQLFGMESFFPPLYFTYFLIALVIVMFVHEFAHGIYMRLYGIKIKSTGVAAFGPILGAFVEQDEKDMRSKKNFEQRVVLAAGTFANIVTGLFFLAIFISFFYLSFIPVGYIFTGYAMGVADVDSVTGIGNLDDELTEIYINNRTFLLDENLKQQLEKEDLEVYQVLFDAPAVRAGLEGAIISINGKETIGQRGLTEVLSEFKPGDEVEIKTIVNGEERLYNLVLDQHPQNPEMVYLGVTNSLMSMTNFVSLLSPQNPTVYYETSWDGEFVFFIYYLLFWIMFLNIMVALFNMLPLGILDGGRFFELTILSITKSEDVANKFYKFLTYAILFGFLIMMVFWYFARF